MSVSDSESDACPVSGGPRLGGWRTPLRVIAQPSEAAWAAEGGGRDRGVAWFGLAMWAAYLVLLPVGRAFDPVLWVMGFIWMCWRAPQPIRVAVTPQVLWVERWYTAVFMALWVPMLISAGFSSFSAPVPAHGPAYSAREEALLAAVLHLRFWVAGLLMIVLMQEPLVRRWAGVIALAFALFWSVDALLQGVVGRGLTGPSIEEGMPNGVFRSVGGLGNALAVITPIGVGSVLFSAVATDEQAAWSWGWRGAAVLTWLLSITAVISASRRGALVMMGVWSLIFVFMLLRRASSSMSRRRCAASIAVVLLGGLLVVGGLGFVLGQNPQVRERLEQTRGLFAGDHEQVDEALTGRVSMWRTAIAMTNAHPVLGVGPGNFRLAYPVYAAEGDRWVQSQRKRQWASMTREARRAVRASHGGRDTYPPTFGAMHAHQLQIEALAETGLLGLVGWCVGGGLLVVFVRWSKRLRQTTGNVIPALATGSVAAVVAVLFPLNTHPSLHSGFFGSLCWLTLAVAMPLLAGWPATAEPEGDTDAA